MVPSAIKVSPVGKSAVKLMTRLPLKNKFPLVMGNRGSKSVHAHVAILAANAIKRAVRDGSIERMNLCVLMSVVALCYKKCCV